MRSHRVFCRYGMTNAEHGEIYQMPDVHIQKDTKSQQMSVPLASADYAASTSPDTP